MSTMSVESNLNPNAPLFIPAAYQQVEDFSPEWWELVKTTGWFRDHWFRQHQEQETFDGSDDAEKDVASLLPDSSDLFDDFSESELADEAGFGSAPATNGFMGPDLVSDAETVMKSLASPRNGGVKLMVEPAKYSEKPGRHANPNFSPRRIIQQPR